MRSMKLVIILLTLVILFCACAQNSTNETNIDASDLVEESRDVFDQMQEIADTNSAVTVEEYVIPDASCFTTGLTEGGITIKAYLGDAKAIEIPGEINGATVVSIESGAFTNSEITGVKIPDSVTVIKEKAFYYCMTLVEVTLGNGVQEIGYEAFEGCLALKGVALNEGLRRIGSMAFANTPSLSEISLPSSMETIGEGTFTLSGIYEITVPGNVKSVERQLFSTCSNLKSVTIEEGTEIINNKAFEDCQSLLTVEIPSSVQEIGALAFMYSENVTIVAQVGSVAEAFAQEAGISFSAK